MLWVILFLVIVTGSILLSYRTARQFGSQSIFKDIYELYLVKNASALTTQFFQKLIQNPRFSQISINTEILFKGSTKALVIYAPTNFKRYFPQLILQEIEEYADNFAPDQVIIFPVRLNGERLSQIEKLNLNLPLKENEMFCWQIITKEINDPENILISLIGLLQSPDPKRLLKLEETLSQKLEQLSLITANTYSVTEGQISYLIRQFNPSQSSVVKLADLIKLIKI